MSTAILLVSHPTPPAKSGIVRYCHQRLQKRRYAASSSTISASRLRPFRRWRPAERSGSATHASCKSAVTAPAPPNRRAATSVAPPPAPSSTGRHFGFGEEEGSPASPARAHSKPGGGSPEACTSPCRAHSIGRRVTSRPRGRRRGGASSAAAWQRSEQSRSGRLVRLIAIKTSQRGCIISTDQLSARLNNTT
eukprot:scaffold99678_cov63-Phaeocystis_antarctica.AAC.1